MNVVVTIPGGCKIFPTRLWHKHHQATGSASGVTGAAFILLYAHPAILPGIAEPRIHLQHFNRRSTTGELARIASKKNYNNKGTAQLLSF